MSQQQVGPVYSKIIDEVCDASQVDFEEGGVDADTLKLLKQRWQKKLSALEVGQFPWEPQSQTSTSASVGSAATITPQSTPSISSIPSKSQQQVASENARPSPAPPSGQGSRIKPEVGQYQPSGSPSMGYPTSQLPPLPPGTTMNAVAQQRAAQALQQKFGARADASIHHLQQTTGQRPQPGLHSSQYQEGEDRKAGLPSFSPPVAQSRTPLQSAQQDGGHESLAEWRAELTRRRAMAEKAPVRGERLFHDHMLLRQQQMEGGGLMIPLDDRHLPSAATKRRVDALFSADVEVHPRRASPPAASSLSQAQGDAQADDDGEEKELDEDAINSDLDDDDAGGDPEDETVEQVMLCTYDKVQRVKNKWKCTLKDGILRVANKEYVFHKGQGEFEW